MSKSVSRTCLGAAAALLLTGASASAMECATSEEVEAFRLRHLQSRYFERTGGGAAALNRHVTEIANAAGLDRAEKRDAYCRLTWDMFWKLSQAPQDLSVIAGSNMIASVEQPMLCSQVPAMVTAGAAAPANAGTAAVPAAAPSPAGAPATAVTK
jgi:hypothetical protein